MKSHLRFNVYLLAVIPGASTRVNVALGKYGGICGNDDYHY